MNWKFWKKEKKFKQVLNWTKQCFKIGGYMYTFYGDVWVDEDEKYYDDRGFPIENICLNIVDPFNYDAPGRYANGSTTQKIWFPLSYSYTLIEDKVPEIGKWAKEIRDKFLTIKEGTYSNSNIWLSDPLNSSYNVKLLKKYVDNNGEYYVTIEYSNIFGEKTEVVNRKMCIELFQIFEANKHNELTEIK